MSDPGEATILLQRLNAGDSSAADELAPLLYEELHRLAVRMMDDALPGVTLQPTALVNEAFIRLVGGDVEGWGGRSHFFGVASKAMRSALVDNARRRGALKRGDPRDRVALDQVSMVFEEKAIDLLALEDGLCELEKVDPELVRIVELRFFGGLNHPEIARVIDKPLRTVERGWSAARAWLYSRIRKSQLDG